MIGPPLSMRGLVVSGQSLLTHSAESLDKGVE